MRPWFIGLALVLAWAGLELVLQLAGLASHWIFRPRLDYPGAPVILCLGDSHTFGVGVPADRTYPVQLERLLTDQGLPVNAVNLGVPGQNTSQIRRNLPEWIARYHPAAVVVEAGVNDGWNQADALYVELEEGRLQDRPYQLWRARMLNGLSYLKTYRLLAYLFRRIETGRREIEQARDRGGQLALHDYDPAAAPPEPYGDARRAFRNLCRIGALGQERGVPVVLMTYVGVPPITFDTVNQVLRQAGRDCGLPLVDNDAILHPELVSPSGLVNSDLVNRLFFPDLHPTGDGYGRIAQNLARTLRERGLIPAPGGKLEKP